MRVGETPWATYRYGKEKYFGVLRNQTFETIEEIMDSIILSCGQAKSGDVNPYTIHGEKENILPDAKIFCLFWLVIQG